MAKFDKREGMPQMFSSITGTDALIPERLMLKVMRELANAKVICGKCHAFRTIHIKKHRNPGKEYITIKCKCGVAIVYPPRGDRGYAWLSQWVGADKYDKNKYSRFTGRDRESEPESKREVHSSTSLA